MGERREKAYIWAFWLILALGCFARLWRFGALPGGLNRDEAFAAYEAWALLRFGQDSAGYVRPVYLIAWGSGMNALESYLLIPVFALFGVSDLTARLPQLAVGLLSLPVFYDLLRRWSDRESALLGLLLLALCPWHVMLSRWALESNLAPGFLLFGLYAFQRGLEKPRWLWLSALCYGLSLYAYATLWPLLPPLLLVQGLYAWRRGALRPSRSLLGALVLLLLLALPLLLFVGVNLGLLEELRGPLFSVPRLLVFRSGDLALRELPQNLARLGMLILSGSDGLLWNSPGVYGQLYPLSLPFALWGLWRCLRRDRSREGFRPGAVLLLYLGAALLLGGLIQVNVNRVNVLYLPLIALTALGLRRLWALSPRRLLPLALAAYLLCFAGFERYYNTEYPRPIGWQFSQGLEQCLQAAREREGEIGLSQFVFYPQVLLYGRVPPQDFRESVVYENYPAAFLQPERFGRYRFGGDRPRAGTDCYVLDPWADRSAFARAGFVLEDFGYYTLAYRS